MLNWGKQKDIREVKRRVGDRMCLMGNVNPLEIAVRGTPDEVRADNCVFRQACEESDVVCELHAGILEESVP